MQVPIRKSEQSRRYTEQGGPVYLTAPGIARLKNNLNDLIEQLPGAIAEVQRTGQMGDFSENAAYQDAKGRMRRIHARIAILTDRLNRAQVIKPDHHSTKIQLGSTVVLDIYGEEKTFEIVGPTETNPARGRISHLSPLGAALIGRSPGDEFFVKAGKNETAYKIVKLL